MKTFKERKQSEFIKVLRLQLSKFPSTYITSLSSQETTNKITGFLKKNNIDIKPAKIKDEIDMLLIGIESYKLFPGVLISEYGVSEKTALKIRDFVNTDLYRFIVENMDSQENNTSSKTPDIPVPPPPGGGGGDTPSPSYGGTSDPYREPVDD